MFRRTVLKRVTMPLRRVNVKGFWLVENKHLAFAAFVVGASMYALRTGIKNDVKEVRTEIKELRTELKNDIREMRTEFKNDMRELRTEFKNDIWALRMEIRTSLAAMNTSRGAMDAHAQFLRDANVGKTAPPLP